MAALCAHSSYLALVSIQPRAQLYLDPLRAPQRLTENPILRTSTYPNAWDPILCPFFAPTPSRFEEHLRALLKQKRRVEANVFLRRLEHYDRNPPHLAASLLGGGASHKAVIPAWYQRLSAPEATGGSSSIGGGGGGTDGDDGDGVEEVVDLTEKEVEVVECLDNEPLDCVMTRIVKQEPGLEEEEDGRGSGAGAGRGEALAAGGGAAADRLGSFNGATGAGSSTAGPRVKMEVG